MVNERSGKSYELVFLCRDGAWNQRDKGEGYGRSSAMIARHQRLEGPCCHWLPLCISLCIDGAGFLFVGVGGGEGWLHCWCAAF